MKMRSFKDASTLAKSATILATIFLISAGLCGIATMVPSNGFQNNDLAISIAGAIGIIGSSIGLASVGITVLVQFLTRKITGKEPPP
jgi:hypothetical protein